MKLIMYVVNDADWEGYSRKIFFPTKEEAEEHKAIMEEQHDTGNWDIKEISVDIIIDAVRDFTDIYENKVDIVSVKLANEFSVAVNY